MIDAGNPGRARVFLEAAKRSGASDALVERDIEFMLDLSVPQRRRAREIEVMAADEMELARRDAARALLSHPSVGTDQERIRASNTVQMVEFKRKQEAPALKAQYGIDLPPID